jgi:hypothetical protein
MKALMPARDIHLPGWLSRADLIMSKYIIIANE